MKRIRNEESSGKSSAAKRAAWAQGKFSRVKPWSNWGAMRVQRGTPENLQRFGASWKDASQEQRDMRVATGYTGRGLYVGRGMYTGRGMYFAPAAAYAATKAIDYAVANPKATRKFISNVGRKLIGRGEYEMTHSNELMAGSTSSPPVFMSAGDEAGALIISHREYVGDIFAPAAATVSDFTVQAFPLNPGLEQTFPWLSQIAQNYEEYELKQCVFEFVSTVQDINSSNGQVGTIITATQYNPSRPDFADKPAMAAYAHSVSGKSTDNQTHGVECDPKKLSGSEGKFVRANPVMFGEDLKTYDHGRFQLATHNIPAAMASGTLGELYVQYTVCLRKPKFFTGRGLGLTRYVEVADATQGASLTNVRPFGSDGEELVARQNNLAVLVTKTDNDLKFTFPAYYGGRMRIIMCVEGSGLTGEINAGTPPVAGNVELISDLYASTSSTGDSPGAWIEVNSAGRMYLMTSVNIEPSTNATDNTISFVLAITGGTVNQSYIEVTEYNTFGESGAPQLVNSAGTAVSL